jgi:hypothetical protein
MKLVTVISTGRSPHLPKGAVVTLPAPDAQVLVDKGAAYYEGEEPKEKEQQTHVNKETEIEPTKKRTRRK